MRLMAILLVVALSVDAQEKRPPARGEAAALAKAWLDLQRSYDEIPGMSYAVVRGEETLLTGGAGLADPAKKEPATASTMYSICSVSKLFTSVAAMQLRDEGKLALNDPVVKHLPWFTIPPGPDGGVVTVENILTHSSGLPRESDFPYWSGNFEFPTREQIRERISSQTMLYPSDTYHQYSNLGLTLAGEIVEAVAKKPYDTVVRERILTPLGMSSTTTDIPSGKPMAVGYSARRRDGTRAVLPPFVTRAIAPAAGFASTAADLAKFAAWQLRVLDKGGDSILSARTLREMQRVHFVDPGFEIYWGLGFGIRRQNDKTFIGHGGSCPGYRTYVAIEPSEKVGVAVLANASGTPVHDYARVLYEILAPAKTDGAPAEALAPYLGSYSDYPWGGETMFFSWGGELASVSLPTMNPVRDMERYRKTGTHEFRRIRKDGTLGEPALFEIGPEGRALSVRIHSNVWPRM
jgi:CubicO group peptidase (beta-lactamase class C family)